MSEAKTQDWWLHQVYRQTKDFLGNPSREKEERLVRLLADYRQFREQHEFVETGDEHEHLMDFR